MRLKTQDSRLKTFIFFCGLLTVVCGLCGCDAFVRKFTRKPKREPPKEELVLAPEEYKIQPIAKEDLYRQYFIFWKSWHNELIDALSIGVSHKRQIYCINEATKNLEQMKPLLREEKQKKIEISIEQLNGLKAQLEEDLYGNNISVNRLTAERIKRGILRDFSYNKTKDCLL